MAQFLKLPIMHRSRPEDLPGVTGRARLDRRTKNLTKRLGPGEIAIIDHADLDRVSADALVRLRAAAVVNVAPSITGRYPNLGPQVLVEAGIPLVDEVAPDVFTRVREGALVRLDGDTLYVGEEVVAKGQLLTPEQITAATAEAKNGIAVQLQSFVTNTLDYMKDEGGLLIDGIVVPELRTRIDGRHVLVVTRGHRYREDLAALRAYIREFKPVMIGVDGGADALLEAGYQPDIIVGDMDSVTDEGLDCGAELIVHAYPDGTGPGPGPDRPARPALGALPGGRDQRGRRAAAGRREGRHPDRRGGHPLHPGRVPGQGAARACQHVADPAPGGQQAGGREGRQPAVPGPDLRLGAGAARRRGLLRDPGCPARFPGGPDLLHLSRCPVGCGEVLAERAVLGQGVRS